MDITNPLPVFLITEVLYSNGKVNKTEILAGESFEFTFNINIVDATAVHRCDNKMVSLALT